MTSNLKELFRSKDLLYMLTWRDIRVRYKQSVMGFFWAILMPSMVVGAGLLVRFAAAQWSGSTLTSGSIGSVMVRAVAWSFFIAGVRFGTNSLVANPNLVTKIAFPKEVFPLSAVLANLLDFFIALVAVFAVMLFMGWRPELAALSLIPLMGLLCAFTAGLALFLSAANLFFRDVKYLVEAILTYAIFFTPVLYEASALGKWRTLVLLNPIAPILEAISDTVVYGRLPDAAWLAYSAVISIASLVLSYSLFKALESKFAESI